MELNLSVVVIVLYYGQVFFEGLKVFEIVDGKCVLFCFEMNVKRMQYGVRKLFMQVFFEEMFVNVVKEVVRLNCCFVFFVDSGASFYVRLLFIGMGVRVGVHPLDEYMFILFVMFCGPYFKYGLCPIRLCVEEEVYRVVFLGVGDIKAVGNYVVGMCVMYMVWDQGYNDVLYLDVCEGCYVDESGLVNFFGIKHEGQSAMYVIL